MMTRLSLHSQGQKQLLFWLLSEMPQAPKVLLTQRMHVPPALQMPLLLLKAIVRALASAGQT